MSSFQYQPLGVGQIRILRVLPGYQENVLKGELSTASIDDTAQSFDALSYMWGDPAPIDTIELSGQPIPIASNLAVALRHLRYVDKPLVIWIDAICINQQDLDERSRQVQFMRQLYSRAEIVRIWINEPHVDSQSDAVRALQNFDSVPKTADDLWHGLGPDPSFWDPVAPLFRNNYWGRAWIQQEVLNARIIYVKWAKHLAPFKYHTSPAARDVRIGNQFWTLDELLSLHAHELGISDSRDRIYALMHLAADYEDGQIVVDYSKTLVSVAIDATVCHVRSQHDVKFLMTARMVETREDQVSDHSQQQQAPTWLPLAWYEAVPPGKILDVKQFGSGTTCRPDSISISSRRLHLRDFRIDYVRRCLNHDLFIWQATPRQFCESLLGYYLRVYAGSTGEQGGPSPIEANLDDDEALTIIMYEATIGGLALLFDLARDSRAADQHILSDGRLNGDLVQDVDPPTRAATYLIVNELWVQLILMTKDKLLAKVPNCAIQDGIEIWTVLGCPLPVVVRPQRNGTYIHICAAQMPSIQDNELIKGLSSDIQPGDRVGKWLVEDIELE
ncbi:heterokaryon incompatibility protein-domain-containing protein [Paraphoma chrysanthemicola]|uniref:Heterokaryon incompatibility protein-domain-containing protein n=1 Tax=Paraphoma chrysanthemicola TaxID=798071 RepID=A0A8K0VXH8_9PLEO|nr:heterokaryon incompatibility protein-domain-containing protein [Paraphoma chrysanthemicola]